MFKTYNDNNILKIQHLTNMST